MNKQSLFPYSYVMKYILYSILAVIMITGCKNAADIKENELLVPDISDLKMTEDLKKTFAERRKVLMDQTDSGIVVIRSDYGFDGGRHEFRVTNNFYYLTGFVEPAAAVVLDNESSGSCSIYIRKKSIKESVYTGKTPGFGEIKETYKIDTVIELAELHGLIKDRILNSVPVYIDFKDKSLKDSCENILKQYRMRPDILRNVAPFISEMRVHKDSIEIARMQKAIDITGNAIINACRNCRSGMYEFEIEAIIEKTFRKYGSPMPAFTSIVASGPNSVILHYEKSTRKMEDGDLLLLDIGAEYGYYSADISRTIPVNGSFTREQRDIYELVLKAQKAAIAEMYPGNYLIANQNKSNEIITRGLFELGLMTDTMSEWQKKFYLLYPINHYLGMYVHDVGDYGDTDATFYQNIARDTIYGRKLEPGMVLTVEPGLYFRSDGVSQLNELFRNESTKEEISDFIDKVAPVYEKYKDTGIRIEDDILITDEGHFVLSGNIPRGVDEIERMMRKKTR
jgi:Xaa-Pro aminopeptidase